MNAVVREYLLKKRQPSKLTEEDAEDPMAPPEYAEPNPLNSEPEGPGMDPSELADYVRTPVEHAEPGYDPVADLKAAQAAAKQDEARGRFLEGTSRINDAFTGSGVETYKGNHEVADAKDRGAAVREYMLQKYRGKLGDAQTMNAQAALNNSVRARQAPAPAKTVDPLDRDLERKRKEAAIKESEARAAKLQRVPAPKAAKPGKNVNEGLPEGYESSPDNPASQLNKQKFTALVFSQGKMTGLTAKMRNALSRAGAFGANIPGPLKDEIAGLASKIQIEAKNVAELGALSGPDMGLIERIISDPSQISSALRNIPTQLDGLDDWAGNSVNAGLKAYGVRRRGSSSNEAPGADAAKTETKSVGGKNYVRRDGKWVLQ